MAKAIVGDTAVIVDFDTDEEWRTSMAKSCVNEALNVLEAFGRVPAVGDIRIDLWPAVSARMNERLNLAVQLLGGEGETQTLADDVYEGREWLVAEKPTGQEVTHA